MASAVKKKPKPGKSSPKRVAAHKPRPAGKPKPMVDPLADIDEPDRSSPLLAEVDAESLEFIAAIDRFKKEHGRPFPSWSEILLIVRQLGYKRA
jgi:hypothetical protein